MQGLSSKGGERSGRRLWKPRRLGLEAGSIDRVAHERMTQMGEMDSDLVGTAGFEPAGEQARDRFAVGALIHFEPLPVRDGLASIRPHRHLVAGMRMPA